MTRRPRGEDVRLICFPFAGGTASVFEPWSDVPALDVYAVQYPGRETRWREPSLPTIDTLVDALVEGISPLCDGSFAFWGHSFGALVAFELTRQFRLRGRPLPCLVIASGARAPHLEPLNRIHHLPEREFLRELITFNGIGRELLENRELLSAVLPVIQDDFRLFEEYSFSQSEPLPMPISAFGGLQDGKVPVGDLLAWSIHTSNTFRPRFLAGSHFFPFDSVKEFTADVQEDLVQRASGRNLIRKEAGRNE